MEIKQKNRDLNFDKDRFRIQFLNENTIIEETYTQEELIDFAFKVLEIANNNDEFDKLFINKLKSDSTMNSIYEEIKEEIIDKYHEENFDDYDKN